MILFEFLSRISKGQFRSKAWQGLRRRSGGGFPRSLGWFKAQQRQVSSCCRYLSASLISPRSFLPLALISRILNIFLHQFIPTPTVCRHFSAIRIGTCSWLGQNWCQSLCGLPCSCLRCQPWLWRSLLIRLPFPWTKERFLSLFFSVFSLSIPLSHLTKKQRSAVVLQHDTIWIFILYSFIHFC